jgi:Zinc-finger associated domain (zf-AD)
METYEEIEPETVCRICLTDSANLYISIHDEILSVKISDLISEISSTSMCLEPGLSTLICTLCCKNLQQAIRLRRIFLRSEAHLLKSQDYDYEDDDPFLLEDMDIVFVDKPEPENVGIFTDVSPKEEVKIEMDEETTVEVSEVPEEPNDKIQMLYRTPEISSFSLEGETDKTAVLIIPPERLRLSCCMCYHLADTEEELIVHLHTHPERARRSEYRRQVEKALPNDRKEGRKICIKCMKAFYARRQLDAHLKAFYLDQKFQCGCCGSRFGFYDKLKEHERRCMRKATDGKNMFQCPTCEKYLTKAALIEHVKIHSMTEAERTRFKVSVVKISQLSFPLIFDRFSV